MDMSERLVFEKLKEVAAKGEIIGYKELAEATGLGWPKSRFTLPGILGRINEEEVRCHGRPLLAAVVVRKDTGLPGPGFFTCAEALGLWGSGGDKAAFHKAELGRVHNYWRSQPE